MKWLKWIIVLYLAVCVTACSLQRQLLYHPGSSGTMEAPEAYGLEGFTDVSIKDKDGTRIGAWYHAARAGYPTLLYFHGNGGNRANRAPYFHALADAGFGLLAIDYRGYGESAGSPSEEGIYQDARAAIAYATGELHLPMDHIVFYGESLGTGVAVQMATETNPAAVVLQSPYTSIEAVAEDRYSWLPVHWLIEDRFDSIGKIARVHAPLLLFHGEADNVVPVAQGKALFAAAHEPKQAVYFPGEGHNDLDTARRIDALKEFAEKYRLIQP